MAVHNEILNRTSEFARNGALEMLLGSLNDDLALAEESAIKPYKGLQPHLPPVFVMGAPRSGSTLFMQWLASTGAVAYPTNLLSRFWSAPITGSRIQKVMTDPDYDYRGELRDLKGSSGFDSNHGKTVGALSPNEFWYFWRQFFPGNKHQANDVLEGSVDKGRLAAELAGITDVNGKPFAAKGKIFNENISFIADVIPSSLFLWIRRKPEYNVQSLLMARERQYGNMQSWFSFKIKRYEELKSLPPEESVAGQVASINRSVEQAFFDLPDSKKLEIDYESFCDDPKVVYDKISEKLYKQSVVLPDYMESTTFNARNSWRLDWIAREDVLDIYQSYYDRFA